MHWRQAIREKVQTILLNNTDAANRVYTSRATAWWKAELPAIGIYTRSEDAEIFEEAPRSYRRTLSLTIEAVDKEADDLEDNLDTLAEDIEKYIRLETFLGLDYVQDVIYIRTETEIDPGGELEIGSAILTYSIPYTTYQPEELEPAGLDDLEKIAVDWEQPPSDVDTDAQDEINFTP